MKNFKLLMTIGFCFLISFALNAQDIDPNYYYRLSNSFLKEGRSLDTYSDGKNDPFMGKTGSYSGQMWKFTPTGNGYYRLTNAFLGDERSLDTYSNGENQPFMAKTGNYSGQMWKFTPIGNGYYRMTNSFLKEGRSLDTYSNGKNQPFMAKTGNYSGQMWKLTKLSKIKPVADEKPKLDTDVKGANVNLVEFSTGSATGSFKETTPKKWAEYDAKGKKKFQFEETGRDEWSVYMVDKSRGGMKIALDLWQKKVKIDGKPYYDITKASVVPNTNASIKILSYNVMMLNPLIFPNHKQNFRADEIPKAIQRKQNWDVVIFNEAFDNDSRSTLQRAMKNIGYPYSSNVVDKSGNLDDGGTFIQSKYPILKQATFVYSDCATSDCQSNKGAIYVKIKKDNKIVHIFGTHLQSEDSESAIRTKQLKQLNTFIDQHAANADNELIIIAGDLNIGKKSSEYGKSIVTLLKTQQLNTDTGITFAPSENTLAKYRYKGQKEKQYDYILIRKNDNITPAVDYNVEKFKTQSKYNVPAVGDPEGWFDKGTFHYDLSDHYALSAHFVW